MAYPYNCPLLKTGQESVENSALKTIIVTTIGNVSSGHGNSSDSRNCFIQFGCVVHHLLNSLQSELVLAQHKNFH